MRTINSLTFVALLFSLTFCPSLARGREMLVGAIVEETTKDTDIALVVPDRLELICRSGPGTPWGFTFAGFETKWSGGAGPIELEVSGSGGYAPHDLFSLAGLSVDFGRRGNAGGDGGWSERSLFGLGLIGTARATHPPGWGVGTSGKIVFRGKLADAKPAPQRVTLDLAKYAPADWDGRLWIGLMLHNTGPEKSLRVRVLNATPPGGTLGSEIDEKQQPPLMHEHRKAFLESAAAELSKKAASHESADVPDEMKPYAAAAGQDNSPQAQVAAIKAALAKDGGGGGTSAEPFLRLAENYFAFEHQKQDLGSFAERTNALLKHWHDSGEFGKSIGCIVRTATNVEKINLRDIDAGEVIEKSPKSPQVKLSAARHEHEGFQIVFTPLPGCAEKVSVAASDLQNGESVIPAENVTINPIGYVRIYPGEPRERLVPDPFLPNDIPALKAGENQTVWISIRVPDDAKKGEYTGKVTITSPNAEPMDIPIALNVRSFAIPKKISLRSSFWLFRDSINRFFHIKEVKIDDYLNWVDFALAHRVNPIDVHEGYCEPLVDISLPRAEWDPKGEAIRIGTPNPHPDWTKWDRYIDHMVAGGASTIHLGTTHHFGSFFCPPGKAAEKSVSTPEQVAQLEQAIRIMEEHYKSKGVFDLHYLQLRDETSAPESLNVYRKVYNDIPEVKLLLTAMTPPARPVLDIPCPLTRGFDPSWRDEFTHKSGAEYWWYVCVDPPDPYANLFIHQNGAQHRALFWQTWSHGVQGLLYWGLNYWSGYESKWPENVTWQTTRLPAEGAPVIGGVPYGPGDGFSMYPGPNPATPMASIRLECMRDGEEDYEYFMMLDQLIAKAEKSGDASSPALAEAKSARDAAKKLVEGLTEYEKSGPPYLELRQRVGDAIEALLR